MVNNLKNTLYKNFTNARGWKTKRKIVVIESDDWGSIRMPSKIAHSNLIKAGIPVNKSKYDTLDCLESRTDIDSLFEVIAEINRKFDKIPVITFNTVMQNPDFEKIKSDKYQYFYGTHFFDSYKEYYGDNLQDLWEKGITKGYIYPQFHAREHLNPYLWLHDLKMGVQDTLIAFDHHFFGLKTKTASPARKHYLASYYAESTEEFNSIEKTTVEGLEMFRQTFGFASKTFIACNYTWPVHLEKVLHENGVKIIQGQRAQLMPVYQNPIKVIHHYTGQLNSFNQRYTVRNVLFEPYLNHNINWVNKTINDIENAFAWKTPAIISSHRVNYAGSLSEENRDISLKMFKNLFERLIEKHPEVEFMHSAELEMLLNGA